MKLLKQKISYIKNEIYNLSLFKKIVLVLLLSNLFVSGNASLHASNASDYASGAEHYAEEAYTYAAIAEARCSNK
jgi:hypothetical protein